MRHLAVAVAVAVALTAAVASTSRSPPDARIARARAAAPEVHPTAIATTLARSDRLREREPNMDVVGRLNAIVLTERDRRGFYERNRERFGGRSYPQSWVAVDRLARIERLRAELGLPDGPLVSSE